MREVLSIFLGLSVFILLAVAAFLDFRKYKALFKSGAPMTPELFAQRDRYAFSMQVKTVVLFVLCALMQLPILLSALR